VSRDQLARTAASLRPTAGSDTVVYATKLSIQTLGRRVLALETLTNTPAVANIIREAKTFMLPGVIQTGRKQGMRLMDDALAELYDQGLISREEAYSRAEQKQPMRHHVGG